MSAPLAPQLSVMHHIQELRGRLLRIIGVLLVGAGVGYWRRGDLISLMQKPLGQQLYYTSPSGSFEFVMTVSLAAGFVVALPVLIYQLLRYLEPAFPKTLNKKIVTTVITSSCLLAASGVAFAYFISLPMALHFFNTAGTSRLHALISADQYFKFVATYLATFAAVFQLPLLLLFINYFTPLGPGGLRKGRKFVIVGAFAIALVVPSAPDPLSQVILALPIIVLYELSIFVLAVANRRRIAANKLASREAAAPVVSAPLAKPLPRVAPKPVLAASMPTPAASLKRTHGVIDLRQPAEPPRRPVHILDLRPH